MFIKQNFYSRNEIHQVCGGSMQAYLPTQNGQVVAACLREDLNGRAPEFIICGTGPRIASSAETLAEQKNIIPVFIKKEVNQWKYMGLFRCTGSLTGGTEFVRRVLQSNRRPEDVSRVLIMSEQDED